MDTPTLMPREKLLKWGAATLSDEELVAIFLRTGIKNCPVMQLSQQVIAHFGSLRGLLCADQKQFCAVKGIGITQFIQLQACIEMTKRYLSQQIHALPLFDNSETVRFYLQAELECREREVFVALFLDNQHRLIRKEEMFLGSINRAFVYPREVLKTALACNATALIIAHNHPSGEPTPSKADVNVTRRIKAACELIDVELLDHFVIGKGAYFSFLEQQWL